jgi:hypothetical protein
MRGESLVASKPATRIVHAAALRSTTIVPRTCGPKVVSLPHSPMMASSSRRMAPRYTGTTGAVLYGCNFVVATQGAGGDAEDAAEGVGHVALVGKPASERQLGQTQPAAQHRGGASTRTRATLCAIVSPPASASVWKRPKNWPCVSNFTVMRVPARCRSAVAQPPLWYVPER